MIAFYQDVIFPVFAIAIALFIIAWTIKFLFF